MGQQRQLAERRPAQLQLRSRQPAHPGRERHLDNRIHLPFDGLRTGNGAGDRVAKTVDGVTTDYVLDPAAGLTQVLQETTDGQTTSYLYGADLLAQYDSGTWAYHLNDGLGSVRQLADPMGQVVQGYSFSPFGVPLGESGGEPYGFTGEQWDASMGLVYLRARYYDPVTGRFITRDVWPGDYQNPQSLNGFSYVENNPVNQTDPSGFLSDKLIEESLYGLSAEHVFAGRWGLYALLRDAEIGQRMNAHYLDFLYDGPNSPLAPDQGIPWTIECGEDQRIRFRLNGVAKFTLSDFVRYLDKMGETIYLYRGGGLIWREQTFKLHWYQLEGARWYYDGHTTCVPDFIAVGGNQELGKIPIWKLIKIPIGASVLKVRDRYGQQYISIAGTVGLGAGLPYDYWEGYATIPARIDRQYKHIPDKFQLRDIIGGPSAGGSAQIGLGVSVDVWRSGSAVMFSDLWAAGVSVSFSWGIELSERGEAWDWVDRLPMDADSSIRNMPNPHNDTGSPLHNCGCTSANP